jgi:hypothetical protein
MKSVEFSRRVMVVLEARLRFVSLLACLRCMFDYSHFKEIFNIKFHIVRHSNEDNIGNGITLHHHDGVETTNHFHFLMKAKDF